MKNTLFYLVAVFLCTACSTNEDKIINTVENYLKENLDDFGRYESVSWEEPQEIDSIVKYDWRYNAQINNLNMCSKRITDLESNLKVYQDKRDTLSNNYKELISQKEDGINRYGEAQKSLSDFCKNYPYVKGWSIKHSYRAPNKSGVLELQKETFYITDDFSKIVNK